MSHYKPYPAYRESGVEWLDRLPVGWSESRIFGHFEETNSRGGNKGELLAVSQAHGVMPQSEYEITLGRRLSQQASEDYSNYKRVRKGDLIYNKMRMWQGAIGVAPQDGIVSPAYITFRPRPGHLSDYWAELFRIHPFLVEVNRRSQGICDDQNSCNYEDFRQIVVPVPPADDQLAIMASLNRETIRIDALVAKKTEFIELLAKKRQALITHAVTKGLNPKVQMKDSGVEWIGEVPEHWAVSRLGHFASVENGTTPSKDNEAFWLNGTIPWLGSGEVNQQIVTEATQNITELALRSCSLRLLPIDTVIIGMVGQGKTRGLAAILKITATINQNLAAICSGPRLRPMFLLYIFRAAYEWIREAGRGSNQAAMNCEIIREFRFGIPSPEEQDAIISRLSVMNYRIDLLITKTQLSIELLRKRRSALITATVTGQIDLRGFA